MKNIRDQAAKLVIAFAGIALFTACSQLAYPDRQADTSKHKIKSSISVLSGESFDFETNEKIAGLLTINGVVLNATDGRFNYTVLPGRYSVRMGFIGKKWSYKSVTVKRGDSVLLIYHCKKQLFLLSLHCQPDFR